MNVSKVQIGRTVFGPIFAEFAMRLWTYCSMLEEPDQHIALFCARGGLRLEHIYKKFLDAANLTSPVAISPVMISRIAALRPALLRNLDAAFEQIDWEFRNAPLGLVVDALCGAKGFINHEASPLINQTYARADLMEFLVSDAGRPAYAEIVRQADLFQQHFDQVRKGKTRVILCDTGLFGSTAQLVQGARPELPIVSCLFARANYKGLPAPHFDYTIGLSVEGDFYSPLDNRTSALRYWQVIESILEPKLPSVKIFSLEAAGPVSNLEIDGWAAHVTPEPDSIFAGVVDYLEALPPHSTGLIVTQDARQAWQRLKSFLCFPNADLAAALDTGLRSVDFGQDRVVEIKSTQKGLGQVFKRSLWKEGAIADNAGLLTKPLQLALELIYSARWAGRMLRKS